MVFELVEAGAPHLAIRFEPLVELFERFGAKPVQAALAVRADSNQSCVAQHSEMLRHRGLADREAIHERLHRLLTGTKDIEKLAPARLCEHLDRCACSHDTKHA